MSIIILPVELKDAPDINVIGDMAFSTDLLNATLFNRGAASPEQFAEYRAWRLKMIEARLSVKGQCYFKAVEETTGKLVGYVGMMDPTVDVPSLSHLPDGDFMDVAVEADTRAKLQEMHERWMGGKNDVWYVQSMVVDPDYQGRGIATRLLQRGLEETDKAGQAVLLAGTAAGAKLYDQAGFEIVEELMLLDGRYKLQVRIRQPKKHA